MELLKEIYNKDIGVKNQKSVTYTVRKAARAILFDKENKVAMLFVSRDGYHKIPGGGVENNEDIKTALAREIKEETGCTAKIGKEVGMIIEYRDKFKKIQLSYCYMAKVSKYGNHSFTKSEKDAGFQIKWMTLHEAIKKLSKDSPTIYGGKFIVKRDLIFLKRAKNIEE